MRIASWRVPGSIGRSQHVVMVGQKQIGDVIERHGRRLLASSYYLLALTATIGLSGP